MKTTEDIIVQQAIEWMVLLGSEDVTETDRQAFLRWRRENSVHEEICAAIENTLGCIGSSHFAIGLIRDTDRNVLSRRRMLLSLASLPVLISGMGWLVNRQYPLEGLLASVSTSTGERKSLILQDNTHLELNARSAVDFSFRNGDRHLNLIQGEIYLKIKQNVTPFVITTPKQVMYCDEGELNLSGERTNQLLTVVKGSVWLAQRATENSIHINHGESVKLSDSTLTLFSIAPELTYSWRSGYLNVLNQPLSYIIDSIRRYRSGIIRLSEDIANIKLSGVFSLDHTDSTLDSLAEILPIIILRRSRYWIEIHPS